MHGLFGEEHLRRPFEIGTDDTSRHERASESKDEPQGDQKDQGASSLNEYPKDTAAAGSNQSAQPLAAAKGTHDAASSAQNAQPPDSGEEPKPSTSSRLLTKRQLSDMAFSIRELSNKLGKYRLRLDIRNVFVLTKVHDPSLVGHTRSLAEWLLSADSGGTYTVYVEETLKSNKRFDTQGLLASHPSYRDRLKFWTTSLCAEQPHLFDVVIALGGDGTVLYASWLFKTIVPPVLSFSLGSLGFLTKFDFGEYRATLRDAFDRGMSVSLRLRLEATVMRSKWGLHQNQQREKSRIADRDTQEGDEKGPRNVPEEEGDEEEEPPPDLVHELMEGKETHYPEQTRDILNEVVIDRGPNPSKSCDYPRSLPNPHPTMPIHIHISVSNSPPHTNQPTNRSPDSNVLPRAPRRYTPPDHDPRRRPLRLHAHRLNRIQPLRGRVPLPPGQPGHSNHGHLRAHPLLPPDYPPRHHGSADGRAVRRAQ